MDSTTNPASSSVVEHSIKGLTEAQLAELLSINIGDLILVQHHRNQLPDSDSESESGSEDDEDDEDEDDDEDDEADNTPSGPARSSEFDPSTDLAPMMYMVQDIYKDEVTGEIKDIRLLELEFDTYPNNEEHSFQILDYQCVVNIAEGVDQLTKSINELVAEYEHPLHFLPSPDIHAILGAFFDHKCPMACRQGWLRSIDQLHGVLKDYTVPSTRPGERAVCPTCTTVALMKEHQDLRAELETYTIVQDFGKLVDFHGRLQASRRLRGYAFEQFDERRWGYMFDDMISENGSDGDHDDDDDQDDYEEWDEADDPSSNPILRPASKAAIDALPRFTYAQLRKSEEDGKICQVCQEEFKDETQVAQLSCGHFNCEGCLAEWLRHYNNCPACRRVVPEVEESEDEDEDEEHGEVEGEGGSYDEEDEDEDELVDDTTGDDGFP